MQTIRQTLRGRLYGYGSNRPQSVSVKVAHFQTRRGSNEYLAAEEFLGTSLFIHDCSIRLPGGPFQLYFTRHRYLPPNRALLSAHPTTYWSGQILVMRMDGGKHVNLKRGDLALIQKVVRRYGVFGGFCILVGHGRADFFRIDLLKSCPDALVYHALFEWDQS